MWQAGLEPSSGRGTPCPLKHSHNWQSAQRGLRAKEAQRLVRRHWLSCATSTDQATSALTRISEAATGPSLCSQARGCLSRSPLPLLFPPAPLGQPPGQVPRAGSPAQPLRPLLLHRGGPGLRLWGGFQRITRLSGPFDWGNVLLESICLVRGSSTVPLPWQTAAGPPRSRRLLATPGLLETVLPEQRGSESGLLCGACQVPIECLL